jgi:hypothetical protein
VTKLPRMTHRSMDSVLLVVAAGWSGTFRLVQFHRRVRLVACDFITSLASIAEGLNSSWRFH